MKDKDRVKIAIGCDHAGFQLKEQIKKYLLQLHISVCDCGTFSEESCDYPIYCYSVCKKIIHNEADLGIVICKTGIGSAIACNKVKGIRAGLCYNPTAARLTREHNHSNVLAIGAMFTPYDLAVKIVDEFLSASPLADRHKRRVDEIRYIEEGIIEEKLEIPMCREETDVV